MLPSHPRSTRRSRPNGATSIALPARLDLKHRSVSQQIVAHLRNAIRTGQLKTGQQLPPEPELLRQWQVSPASLRDALKELETLGLVRRKPRVGTVIQQFEPIRLFEQCASLLGHRPDLIEDLIQMRDILEAALVPLVIGEATAADWQAMDRAIAGMTAARDFAELARWDLEFHRHYYRATHNTFFAAMVPLLVEYFAIFEPATRGGLTRPQARTVREHRALLKALRKGQVNAARRYIPIFARPRRPPSQMPADA